MSDFKDRALSKLSEWLNGVAFQYRIIKETPDMILFVTVSSGYTSNERTVEIYRVFQVGDNVEISRDLEQVINFQYDSSIVGTILEIVEVYERVK